MAAVWIVVDPLTGTHSGPTQRWMENITILLTAAASIALLAWLMRDPNDQPHNTVERSFELGYHAGRADALSEMRPSLGVVTSLPDRAGRTGT